MTETVFYPGADYRIGDRHADRGLVFFEDRLVVSVDDRRLAIPPLRLLNALPAEGGSALHLGTLAGEVYIGWALRQAPALPDGLALTGLRGLYGQLDAPEFNLAGYALHLLRWMADHRHCGRCGRRLVPAAGERALLCPACRSPLYPQVAPAIIVAVTAGERLLLARSGRFPRKRMFSVIAGYVEPGETLEACVRREIHEEVGLRVRRIRYFGSQAWPFSGSLMVGFTAEHAGGDIRVDGREILEADWFAADGLPDIPGKISIARRLIDWFVETRTGKGREG
jgi:NAD+ diphosphatase